MDPEATELTDDAFLGGALSILQPARAYRAGLDAVLLAAAVPARAGRAAQILDVGAGVGVVGLCLARRLPDAGVTLVEVEPSLAALARRNVARNGLGARVRVVAADVTAGGAGGEALRPASFDHVAANPPFTAAGRASLPPDRRKAGAHAMPGDALDAWMRFIAAACAAGGTATVIHRADALASLMAAMSPRFGALKLLPVHPREREPAHRILVQGIKGSRAPLTLLPGLVLHGPGNAFRPEIEAVLREGAPLPL